MKKVFNNKEKKSGFVHRLKGDGSFSVTVNFLPDYIHAKFATQGTAGNQHDGKASKTDKIYWELTSITPNMYSLTVHYKCTHERCIQWLAANLPKEAYLLLN